MNSQDLLPEDAALWSRPGAPDAFHQAMVHLYRGEMQRMTVWRSRVDTTSNWAILLSTGIATFTLGSPGIPQYKLLLGLALIGICILIEARRYRHLLHSMWRLQVLEANYFSGQLCPSSTGGKTSWGEEIAKDLGRACLTTGRFRGLGRRL